MDAQIAESRAGIGQPRRVSVNLGPGQDNSQTPGEILSLPGQNQEYHAFGEPRECRRHEDAPSRL